jgi:hypothetical protein
MPPQARKRTTDSGENSTPPQTTPPIEPKSNFIQGLAKAIGQLVGDTTERLLSEGASWAKRNVVLTITGAAGIGIGGGILLPEVCSLNPLLLLRPLEKTYHGFYSDFDSNGNQYVAKEELTLRFCPQTKTVTAKTHWISKENDLDIHKYGIYRGFYSNKHIAMSYSEVNDKQTNDIGLTADGSDGSGSVFVFKYEGEKILRGKITFEDCHHIVQSCNYVLSEDDHDAVKAGDSWSILRDKCEPVKGPEIKFAAADDKCVQQPK